LLPPKFYTRREFEVAWADLIVETVRRAAAQHIADKTAPADGDDVVSRAVSVEYARLRREQRLAVIAAMIERRNANHR
jgi:hypothetical protein